MSAAICGSGLSPDVASLIRATNDAVSASLCPGYAAPPGRRNAMRTIATILAAIVALAASSAAAETLKIAVAQRGFWNSTFVEFAQRQGFFKQEGLDIEILYTEGGASTLTPVVAGSLDKIGRAHV